MVHNLLTLLAFMCLRCETAIAPLEGREAEEGKVDKGKAEGNGRKVVSIVLPL